MLVSKEAFRHLRGRPSFRGKVATASMHPVIKVGDTIEVEVGAPDIRRFDLVVIHLDGLLVCHYLWSKNVLVKPILLQTRDIGGGKDRPVRFDEDYLGKVMSHRIGSWRRLMILLRGRA